MLFSQERINSTMIPQEVFDNLNHPRFRALVLDTRWRTISDQVRTGYPQAIYNFECGSFIFPGGAMLTIANLPRNWEAFSRYSGVRFHAIVVNGEAAPIDLDWLGSRLQLDNCVDENSLKLHYWVNGKDLVTDVH